MQVVILVGGYGTRLSEETERLPKPMIEIGGKPILLHIMEHFARYNHTEFVLALGYKGHHIKNYFARLREIESDVEIDLDSGTLRPLSGNSYNWKVKLVDTGLDTATGGRVRRLEKHLNQEFFLTYGDGIADVNLDAIADNFERNSKLAVVTAVKPPPRFGSLDIEGESVISFREKSAQDSGWINGGFFLMRKEVCNYIDSDNEALEAEPLSNIAAQGLLGAHKHHGFWHPMDTLRDKLILENMYREGRLSFKRPNGIESQEK